MAVIAIFEMPGMTAEQYDQIDTALAAVDLRPPTGRIYHVSAPTEDGWMVIDIWEDEDAMGPFAEVLIPILQEAGVQLPEPRILHSHNIIS